MASVPRAARKGGKVAAPSTSTPTLGATSTPPTMSSPLTLPAAGAEGSSPAPATPGSEASTPSFLGGQGSLLQINSDATSAVAVGVVRGRGASQPIQERSVEADHDEVLKLVKEAVSKTVAASPKSPRAVGYFNFDGNDLVVVSDRTVVAQTADFIEVEPASTKVLFVVPYAADVHTKYFKPFEETVPAKTIGTWTGNLNETTDATKLVIADIATVQLHLHTTHGLAPFTHVVFSKSHANPLMHGSFFAEFHQFIINSAPNKRPKFVLTANIDASEQVDPILNFFEPLKGDVQGKSKTAGVALDKDLVFSADQVAALTKLAPVQALKSVDEKTGVPLPPPKVMDRVTAQAVALVEKLVELAGDETLRIAVIVGDVPPVQAALAKSEVKIATTTSVSGLTDASGSVVAVLTHAPTDVTALDLHAVLDLGTERSLYIPSKGEQILPARRTEWASLEERNCRKHLCQGQRPAMYFDLLAEGDVQYCAKFAQEPAATASAESALLQLSRLGLDPVAVLNRGLFRPTGDALATSLLQLSEKGAIASSTAPSITFLGEFLARSGLPTDIASFYLTGVVVGLQELFALASAVVLHPLRPNPPTGAEDWVKTASEAMKNSGIGHGSDIIADIAVVLQWFEKDREADVAKAACVEVERLEAVETTYKGLLSRASDFIIPSATDRSFSDLLSQLKRSAPTIEFFLGVALARNAVTVRSEGVVAGKPATGSLLFVRTTKEVIPSAFAPTTLKWRNSSVVVPCALTNTPFKVYATNGSLIHQNYFFTSLVLLAPCVEYSAPMTHKNEECVGFSVTINRQVKRFYTDLATAARILDFREKWNALLGCVQVKRSLPPRTSRLHIFAALQSKEKNFDVEEAREKLLDEFTSLVESCEMREYQALFDVHGTHRSAPAPTVTIEKIAPATDVTTSNGVAGITEEEVAPTPATANTNGSKEEKKEEASAAAAAPAFQRQVFDEDDDDIEIEGQGFFAAGPIIEEED